MTVHHIDYDKMNVAEWNLITLCSSCNSRANHNRARWVRLYYGLQALRLADTDKLKAAARLYPEHEFLLARWKGGAWTLIDVSAGRG